MYASLLLNRYPLDIDHLSIHTDFKDLTLEDLDELAASFKFENCVQRKGLNDVLQADAATSKV